jgi:hypothetical protein
MKTETLVIGGIVVAAGGYILWKRHKAAVASAAAFGATAGISAMGGISSATSPLPSAAPSLAPDMAARQELIANSGLAASVPGGNPYGTVTGTMTGSTPPVPPGYWSAPASARALTPTPLAVSPTRGSLPTVAPNTLAVAPPPILPSIFAARSRLPALSIPKGF